MRLAAIAMIGAMTAVGSAAVAAGPAVAAKGATPKPEALFLFSSATKVKTSTHHKVIVSVTYNAFTGESPSLGVSVSTPNNQESHDWSFPVTSSVLKVSNSGHGSLSVPKAKLGPYGVIKLKISPAGAAKNDKCSGQLTETYRPIKMSGAFFLDTRSTGKNKWGTVGKKKHFTFTGKGSYSKEYAADCQYPTKCETSLYWDSGYNGASSTPTVDLSGDGKLTGGTINGSRSVSLPKPKGATRSDNVTIKGTWTFSSSTHGATLKVKAGSGGAGTATLSSTQSPYSYPEKCGKNNSKTQKTQDWSASYTNGKPALTLHEQVFGPLSAKNSAEASLDRTTA